MKQAGDQVIEIPDGTYKGSASTGLTANHAATNGPCKGWLVLKAKNPGKVIVDLTNTDSDVYGMEVDNASRIMFVGIKFIKGSISISGSDVIFWYTDHSFFQTTVPSDGATAREAEAAKYGYVKPRLIYFDLKNSKVLGSDFHNTCTSFILRDNIANPEFGGLRTYDNGPTMNDGNLSKQCHADAIASENSSQPGIYIHDSNTENRIQVQSGNSSASLRIENTWLHGSDGMGISVTSSYSGAVTLNNTYAWNNSSNGDYNFVGTGAKSLNLTNLHLTSASSDDNPKSKTLFGVVPSGASSTNDASSRQASTNPALVWRAAHPYDTWVNYLY